MTTARKGEPLSCSIDALRHVAGLSIAEATYPGGYASEPHTEASTLLIVVLDGTMTERRGRKSVLCEPGTLVVLPREEPFAHRFDESGARLFVTQLGPAWAERMRAFGVSEPAAPVYLRSGRANAIAGDLLAEFRAGDDASSLAIQGYTLALSGEIARAGERTERSARPPWLVRATERLHASAGGDVEMAAIAAEVGVHPVHLARTFREHHGTTMGDYLRRLRVERARAQLAATAKPLSQIALEAGFADQAHFTRVFRTIVGATPGAYRRAAGPGAGPGATSQMAMPR